MANNLRSRQLNPCDILYWKSRGYTERPDNWEELVYGENNEDDYYDEDEEYSDEDEEYSDDDEEYSDEEDYSSEEEYDYEHALKSNQNNPNNEEFWRLRGYSCRPQNWKEIIYGN